MKKIISLIVIFVIFSQTAYAVKTEIIANVGKQSLTNIDVFETIQGDSLNNKTTCSPGLAKYVIEKIIPGILIKGYAEKENIKVEKQEVMGRISEEMKKSGRTKEDDFYKGSQRAYDKNLELVKARVYKIQYQNILNIKSVEHFDPNVKILTDKDIQDYIDWYRRSIYPPRVGQVESVLGRGVGILSDLLAKDESLRQSFNTIKERLNKGEDFNSVARDYLNKKELAFSTESQWFPAKDFQRTGADALIPWSACKGKAVSADFSGPQYAVIFKIEDYMPNTRKEIAEAFKDKDLRPMVLKDAQGHKFGQASRRLREKLKAEVVVKYTDSPEKIYQKLADTYPQYIVEIQNDPNLSSQ